MPTYVVNPIRQQHMARHDRYAANALAPTSPLAGGLLSWDKYSSKNEIDGVCTTQHYVQYMFDGAVCTGVCWSNAFSTVVAVVYICCRSPFGRGSVSGVWVGLNTMRSTNSYT